MRTIRTIPYGSFRNDERAGQCAQLTVVINDVDAEEADRRVTGPGVPRGLRWLSEAGPQVVNVASAYSAEFVLSLSANEGETAGEGPVSPQGRLRANLAQGAGFRVDQGVRGFEADENLGEAGSTRLASTRAARITESTRGMRRRARVLVTRSAHYPSAEAVRLRRLHARKRSGLEVSAHLRDPLPVGDLR